MKQHSVFTWVMWALLSTVGLVFVNFYLILYKGFGVPGAMLFGPAIVLAGAALALSTVLYVWHQRKDARLFFLGTGLYMAVFLIEAIHFAIYLGFISAKSATRVYSFGLCFLAVNGLISYYGYQYLSRKNSNDSTT